MSRSTGYFFMTCHNKRAESKKLQESVPRYMQAETTRYAPACADANLNRRIRKADASAVRHRLVQNTCHESIGITYQFIRMDPRLEREQQVECAF